MCKNNERLQDILNYVAANCGLKNWSYKIDETSETLETYFGVLIPLTMIGDIEGQEIVQHIYVKLPTMDDAIRSFSDYIWNCEDYMYGTLVPMWKRLPNVLIDELIPHCYYTDVTPHKQTVVLKNMRYEGFQNYKERFLDFEHVVVSLKSLAEFHALSFIIEEDRRELISSILRPYTHEFPPKFNLALLNCFRTHSHLFKGSKYEHYWEESLANYKTIVTDCFSKAKSLVFGHGDFWRENIMYKYEGKTPVKACILDFQTCRLMTPADDFLFFIMNSTNGKLRRQHYHHFVTEYYTSFKNKLLGYGIQLELLYKKEDFISDLKIVASSCFIRVCLAFSLWLGFERNTIIKSKNSWEDDQQKDKELQHFKEILIDVMEDLCNYGYICF